MVISLVCDGGTHKSGSTIDQGCGIIGRIRSGVNIMEMFGPAAEEGSSEWLSGAGPGNAT